MASKYNSFLIFTDNTLKQREFAVINNAFQAAGIPMAPIKGVALLYEIDKYNEKRPMCDIDILVKKQDLLKAKDTLSLLGYKVPDSEFSENYYLNHYHHLPLKNKYMVEIHWNLSPPRPADIILPELWQRLRRLKREENTISLLSVEDTIFSLALHLRRFNDPFSLRYIQDIYEVLKINMPHIDWRYILKYSGINKLRSLLYYSLLCVKIKLNHPILFKTINMFCPGTLKAFFIKLFISRIKPGYNQKCSYVFLRFLLYDRAMDFVKFIIFMPIEEFTRFYSIKFPSKTAYWAYSLRFIISPFLLLTLLKRK